MVNIKTIIAGIILLALSAFLFLDYDTIFGSITSQPGTYFYMQWFFVGTLIISVMIIFAGITKPGS